MFTFSSSTSTDLKGVNYYNIIILLLQKQDKFDLYRAIRTEGPITNTLKYCNKFKTSHISQFN